MNIEQLTDQQAPDRPGHNVLPKTIKTEVWVRIEPLVLATLLLEATRSHLSRKEEYGLVIYNNNPGDETVLIRLDLSPHLLHRSTE